MKKVFLSFIIIFPLYIFSQTWQAPPSAKKIKNPFQKNQDLEKGKKIYNNLCKSCHGINGKGDPMMIKTLTPPPANFTSKEFQKQTDGEIFWKLSEGKGLMASYKNILSPKERWAVINYIRTLSQKQNLLQKETVHNQKNVVYESFPFTGLINNPTTHIIRNKGFGLIIQHRFGATKFNKEFINNFMGLDLAANIRFGFQIPINQKTYIEIGRTRYGKYYDLGIKYKFISQTEKHPVSMAIYHNTAITTDKTPIYPEGTSFADGSDFEYIFAHRLKYDTQLLISRKFNNRFSGQIATELVWRNLYPLGEKAYVLALPISLRFKTGILSAIDIEITPNSQKHNFPLSLGYEISSSGNHVFQITITNSDRILLQNLLTTPSLKHKDGFILGFNLVRYF